MGPTSGPEISKIEPPLQREHDFSKNRFSQLASIFNRFWCQLGSILPSKIHQNPPKNRSQDASNFWSIFASIFLHFGSILGPKLGPCWPHFRAEWGAGVYAAPVVVGSMFFFDLLVVLDPSWPDLGSILDGLGLHFGGFWAPFWRFLVTICVPCAL